MSGNQIILIGLVSRKDYYKRKSGVMGVFGKVHFGVFLRGSVCAEGMACGKRWVIWVLQGTGTVSWRRKCLEGFHRGFADYLSRQFVPKSDTRMVKAYWRIPKH